MTRQRLVLVVAALIGLTIGIGGYTFVYAKGYSYLTNDPAACANCHVMQDHYRAWTRASHRAVAVCNDCHTPPGLVPKYVTKARNGFWHSFYFTTGGYPDPRSIVAQSRLEEDPRLKTMWAGYAFATDFREECGHAYMLSDQTFTERQHVAQQPGTCMHCHASVYVPYKKLGGGDLFKGFDLMNRMTYQEARTKVEHPVSCIDCHGGIVASPSGAPARGSIIVHIRA